MKRLMLALAGLVALISAGAIGYFVARSSAPAPAPAQATTAQASNGKILYWYDPMVPQQHFDHPGLSPMGMQMVPKYAAGDSGDVVRVAPGEVQNLGVRTAAVNIGRLSGTVHVPGTVAWDPRLAVTVSARTDATIETLYVRAPFTAVKAGQPLAAILAPQWSAAAAEYFALADARSAPAQALRQAARERLHVLGMDDATIRGLRAGSGAIILRAPADGVVSRLDAQQGQQVGAGAPIMTLNGLDRVWLDAAIPQSQSAGVSAGTPITATVSALPGEVFHGKVDALLPDVDGTTRTQRARIVLDNPGHALAPGMFADVRITGAAGTAHPLVPDGALITDGSDTRVIEALGDGRFRPVRVRTGRSADGATEILAGLRGGERIVTSGQFLLDSEASLSGALQRLGGDAAADQSEPAAPLPPGPESDAMPGMPMPAAPAAGASHADQPQPAAAQSSPHMGSDMSGMSMPASASTAGAHR